MKEESKTTETVDAEWRERFLQAAKDHADKRDSWIYRSPWVRRVAAGVAVAAIAGGAGVAVAQIAGNDDPTGSFDPATGEFEPTYPKSGEVLGYVNLDTGDPIRCADGKLLIYTPPPGNIARPGYPLEPHCSDGTQPDVYKIQQADFEKFLNAGPGGQDVKDGPNFSVELSKMKEAGVPMRVPSQ